MLRKAEHIVNRIKSKAVGSNGLFVPTSGSTSANTGTGVCLNLPMTPAHGKRTERSWHFDVSNENSVRSSRSPQKVKRTRESYQLSK